MYLKKSNYNFRLPYTISFLGHYSYRVDLLYYIIAKFQESFLVHSLPLALINNLEIYMQSVLFVAFVVVIIDYLEPRIVLLLLCFSIVFVYFSSAFKISAAKYLCKLKIIKVSII